MKKKVKTSSAYLRAMLGSTESNPIDNNPNYINLSNQRKHRSSAPQLTQNSRRKLAWNQRP